jgi:hypothetical protein
VEIEQRLLKKPSYSRPNRPLVVDKRTIWKVVGVSKMSAGNYMQEGYNHVIHVKRQNKGEKMQTLGVQKGGIVN